MLIAVPTWLRAHHFGFANYDFGIYSQALARLALDPPNPWLSGRQLFVFNDHFDPVLFLFAPFARVFPAASVGLVAEALFASLSLVPLAWLAREGRLSARGLWTFGVLLALNVGLTQAMGFPFHPTTWAVAPLAWLLAAVVLERWGVALVALVVLFTFKEEFPFVGLALAPLVWVRAPRRLAVGWVVASLGWALFAFVLRPRLFGEVMPYASVPFRGWDEGVGAFLAARFAPGVLAGAGDLVVAFVPLIISFALTRTRPGWLWLALVPMVSIRFLSMAWRDHYGAVVAVGLVFWLVDWWGRTKRELPWWVVAASVVLVLVTNESGLRRSVRSLSGAQGWGASTGCIDVPQRREAVARAVEMVRAAPGPLFVSGNLLPWLAERGDVYAIGGPQGDAVKAVTVLVEQPLCGDTWAQSPEQRLESWNRARIAKTVVVDDGFVIVASP
ncbi:MAG: DUF2079 domain-containing protein [Myxococcaceae bacterium]